MACIGMTRGLACGIALGLLAGCGGSGGGTDGAPTRQSSYSNIPPNRFVYDVAARRLTLIYESGGGLVDWRALDPDGLQDGFYSHGRLEENSFTPRRMFIIGQTPSGGGWVFSDVQASGLAGYQFDRVFRTDLPDASAGSATYLGDYAGQYARFEVTVGGSEFQDFGHMLGDVELTVDFMDGDVSGRISGRANTGGADAADVVLQSGNLDAGSFSGGTLGGTFVGGTSSSGTYAGMLVGANGEEIIGNIRISHGAGSNRYVESGSFIAVHEP